MSSAFMERTGKIEEMDRSFDRQFWQSQSDEARLAAAWELVVDAHILKGGNVNELQLQRTVEHFGRQRR